MRVVSPPRAVFASYLIRFRPANDINGEYVACFLLSHPIGDKFGRAQQALRFPMLTPQSSKVLISRSHHLASRSGLWRKLDALLSQEAAKLGAQTAADFTLSVTDLTLSEKDFSPFLNNAHKIRRENTKSEMLTRLRPTLARQEAESCNAFHCCPSWRKASASDQASNRSVLWPLGALRSR